MISVRLLIFYHLLLLILLGNFLIFNHFQIMFFFFFLFLWWKWVLSLFVFNYFLWLDLILVRCEETFVMRISLLFYECLFYFLLWRISWGKIDIASIRHSRTWKNIINAFSVHYLSSLTLSTCFIRFFHLFSLNLNSLTHYSI